MEHKQTKAEYIFLKKNFSSKPKSFENLKFILINLTWQVAEPLGNIKNSLYSSSSSLEIIFSVKIVIFFKTLPFFNKYFATSFSIDHPLNPLMVIFLRCNNKQMGTNSGSFHCSSEGCFSQSIFCKSIIQENEWDA